MFNFSVSSFKLDNLNSFILLGIILFFIVTLVYSLKFMKGKRGLVKYYTYIILTAVASILAALSNNLILLAIFWGFLGMTLYLLINMGEDTSGAVAKKTLIIIGGTDALMLMGIAIIYSLAGTFQMDQISISLSGRQGGLAAVGYICIAIGCFAKAGAMPFHTWIPDCAEHAPIPVTAFLPASLDKLLGIYLLSRISMDLFVMNPAMNTMLMVVGAFTIVAAVMMALVQHNMKRLLGYHAVSQVGYMVLGIGTGTILGIAGGMFHMLNHAIYKSCLFFTAGNVEYRAKTSELDKLGGLAKFMPITYISCLVASFAISGVPPFNGFFSKWMIYQGLIVKLRGSVGSSQMIAAICLIAAMFGSGLTLASFMKLIHATFLGQRTAGSKDKQIREVSWMMWAPAAFLAFLCILFGVLAYQLPLRYFISPAVGKIFFIGSWYSGLSSLLIVIGLFLGILIFKFKSLKPAIREDKAFTGCEPLVLKENRFSGVEFYNTIKEYGVLKIIYNKAQAGYFDIYEQGKNFVFGLGSFLRYLHNGVLPTYLVWTLLGMIVLFFVLVNK